MRRLSDRWMYYCGLLAMHNVGVDDLKHIQDLVDAEEQGLLMRLPIAVNDVVGKLFSRYEIISLWREEKEGSGCYERIWYGRAWDIPEELKSCKFVGIFGSIPQSLAHADIINIEVVLSEAAKAALEKMKEGRNEQINSL